MSSILSGLIAGGWPFLVGWIFPSAIAVGLIAFLIVPSLAHLGLVQALLQLTAAERTAVLAGVALALGLILSALQTPLYRVLEGYLLWPPSVAAKARARQLAKKERLRAQRQGTGDQAVRSKALRQLQRFPVEDREVRPTQLGNAIRAFETYGWNKYQIDTVTFWYSLTAVVPPQVRLAEERARAGVDFFVSLFYLSWLAAASAIIALVVDSGRRWFLVILASILVVLSPLWYRMAVTATAEWSASVRAIVDLGRKPLATALGLQLPRTLDTERDMWRKWGWLVKYPYAAKRSKDLYPFRTTSEPRHPSRRRDT